MLGDIFVNPCVPLHTHYTLQTLHEGGYIACLGLGYAEQVVSDSAQHS